MIARENGAVNYWNENELDKYIIIDLWMHKWKYGY